MAAAIDVDATISRPPEDVWSVMTDWRNAPRWMGGIDEMRADGAPVAGTTVTFRARGKDRSAVITEAEPARSLVLRSVQGAVAADYTYTLHGAADGSTRVTLVAECTTQALGWRLVLPILRFAIRRTDGGQLEALKAVVEGNGR